jgi:hypothetical protein
MEHAITEEMLRRWFTYHPPTGDQGAAYVAIRDAAFRFAMVVAEHTPPSPDQTTAIRKIREVVMTANAAIACEGR